MTSLQLPSACNLFGGGSTPTAWTQPNFNYPTGNSPSAILNAHHSVSPPNPAMTSASLNTNMTSAMFAPASHSSMLMTSHNTPTLPPMSSHTPGNVSPNSSTLPNIALTSYDPVTYSNCLTSPTPYTTGALPLMPTTDLRQGIGASSGFYGYNNTSDRSYMVANLNKGYYSNYCDNLTSLTSSFMRPGRTHSSTLPSSKY